MESLSRTRAKKIQSSSLMWHRLKKFFTSRPGSRCQWTHANRSENLCHFQCNSEEGIFIACSNPNCTSNAHPKCASRKGLLFLDDNDALIYECQKHFQEPVFCICKTLYGVKKDDMIMCMDCHGWYHHSCIGDVPALDEDSDYHCKFCLEGTMDDKTRKENYEKDIHSTGKDRASRLLEILAAIEEKVCPVIDLLDSDDNGAVKLRISDIDDALAVLELFFSCKSDDQEIWRDDTYMLNELLSTWWNRLEECSVATTEAEDDMRTVCRKTLGPLCSVITNGDLLSAANLDMLTNISDELNSVVSEAEGLIPPPDFLESCEVFVLVTEWLRDLKEALIGEVSYGQLDPHVNTGKSILKSTTSEDCVQQLMQCFECAVKALNSEVNDLNVFFVRTRAVLADKLSEEDIIALLKKGEGFAIRPSLISDLLETQREWESLVEKIRSLAGLNEESIPNIRNLIKKVEVCQVHIDMEIDLHCILHNLEDISRFTQCDMSNTSMNRILFEDAEIFLGRVFNNDIYSDECNDIRRKISDMYELANCSREADDVKKLLLTDDASFVLAWKNSISRTIHTLHELGLVTREERGLLYLERSCGLVEEMQELGVNLDSIDVDAITQKHSIILSDPISRTFPATQAISTFLTESLAKLKTKCQERDSLRTALRDMVHKCRDGNACTAEDMNAAVLSVREYQALANDDSLLLEAAELQRKASLVEMRLSAGPYSEESLVDVASRVLECPRTLSATVKCMRHLPFTKRLSDSLVRAYDVWMHQGTLNTLLPRIVEFISHYVSSGVNEDMGSTMTTIDLKSVSDLCDELETSCVSLEQFVLPKAASDLGDRDFMFSKSTINDTEHCTAQCRAYLLATRTLLLLLYRAPLSDAEDMRAAWSPDSQYMENIQPYSSRIFMHLTSAIDATSTLLGDITALFCSIESRIQEMNSRYMAESESMSRTEILLEVTVALHEEVSPLFSKALAIRDKIGDSSGRVVPRGSSTDINLSTVSIANVIFALPQVDEKLTAMLKTMKILDDIAGNAPAFMALLCRPNECEPNLLPWERFQDIRTALHQSNFILNTGMIWNDWAAEVDRIFLAAKEWISNAKAVLPKISTRTQLKKTHKKYSLEDYENLMSEPIAVILHPPSYDTFLDIHSTAIHCEQEMTKLLFLPWESNGFSESKGSDAEDVEQEYFGRYALELHKVEVLLLQERLEGLPVMAMCTTVLEWMVAVLEWIIAFPENAIKMVQGHQDRGSIISVDMCRQKLASGRSLVRDISPKYAPQLLSRGVFIKDPDAGDSERYVMNKSLSPYFTCATDLFDALSQTDEWIGGARAALDKKRRCRDTAVLEYLIGEYDSLKLLPHTSFLQDLQSLLERLNKGEDESDEEMEIDNSRNYHGSAEECIDLLSDSEENGDETLTEHSKVINENLSVIVLKKISGTTTQRQLSKHEKSSDHSVDTTRSSKSKLNEKSATSRKVSKISSLDRKSTKPSQASKGNKSPTSVSATSQDRYRIQFVEGGVCIVDKYMRSPDSDYCTEKCMASATGNLLDSLLEYRKLLAVSSDSSEWNGSGIKAKDIRVYRSEWADERFQGEDLHNLMFSRKAEDRTNHSDSVAGNLPRVSASVLMPEDDNIPNKSVLTNDGKTEKDTRVRIRCCFKEGFLTALMHLGIPCANASAVILAYNVESTIHAHVNAQKHTSSNYITICRKYLKIFKQPHNYDKVLMLLASELKFDQLLVKPTDFFASPAVREEREKTAQESERERAALGESTQALLEAKRREAGSGETWRDGKSSSTATRIEFQEKLNPRSVSPLPDIVVDVDLIEPPVRSPRAALKPQQAEKASRLPSQAVSAPEPTSIGELPVSSSIGESLDRAPRPLQNISTLMRDPVDTASNVSESTSRAINQALSSFGKPSNPLGAPHLHLVKPYPAVPIDKSELIYTKYKKGEFALYYKTGDAKNWLYCNAFSPDLTTEGVLADMCYMQKQIRCSRNVYRDLKEKKALNGIKLVPIGVCVKRGNCRPDYGTDMTGSLYSSLCANTRTEENPMICPFSIGSSNKDERMMYLMAPQLIRILPPEVVSVYDAMFRTRENGRWLFGFIEMAENEEGPLSAICRKAFKLRDAIASGAVVNKDCDTFIKKLIARNQKKPQGEWVDFLNEGHPDLPFFRSLIEDIFPKTQRVDGRIPQHSTGDSLSSGHAAIERSGPLSTTRQPSDRHTGIDNTMDPIGGSGTEQRYMNVNRRFASGKVHDLDGGDSTFENTSPHELTSLSTSRESESKSWGDVSTNWGHNSYSTLNTSRNGTSLPRSVDTRFLDKGKTYATKQSTPSTQSGWGGHSKGWGADSVDKRVTDHNTAGKSTTHLVSVSSERGSSRSTQNIDRILDSPSHDRSSSGERSYSTRRKDDTEGSTEPHFHVNSRDRNVESDTRGSSKSATWGAASSGWGGSGSQGGYGSRASTVASSVMDSSRYEKRRRRDSPSHDRSSSGERSYSTRRKDDTEGSTEPHFHVNSRDRNVESDTRGSSKSATWGAASSGWGGSGSQGGYGSRASTVASSVMDSSRYEKRRRRDSPSHDRSSSGERSYSTRRKDDTEGSTEPYFQVNSRDRNVESDTRGSSKSATWGAASSGWGGSGSQGGYGSRASTVASSVMDSSRYEKRRRRDSPSHDRSSSGERSYSTRRKDDTEGSTEPYFHVNSRDRNVESDTRGSSKSATWGAASSGWGGSGSQGGYGSRASTVASSVMDSSRYEKRRRRDSPSHDRSSSGERSYSTRRKDDTEGSTEPHFHVNSRDRNVESDTRGSSKSATWGAASSGWGGSGSQGGYGSRASTVASSVMDSSRYEKRRRRDSPSHDRSSSGERSYSTRRKDDTEGSTEPHFHVNSRDRNVESDTRGSSKSATWGAASSGWGGSGSHDGSIVSPYSTVPGSVRTSEKFHERKQSRFSPLGQTSKGKSDVRGSSLDNVEKSSTSRTVSNQSLNSWGAASVGWG